MKIYEAMLTNNEIKLINSLSRKKERKEHGLFIVEGDKNIEELLKSDFSVEKIFGIDDQFIQCDQFEKITRQQLDRISQFKSSSEALALVRLPEDIAANLSEPSILLEDINDPGNLGTIIRTADWFGIKQIVCSTHSVDCFNPKVVSATKGSLFRINVVYVDLKEFVKESVLPCIATSLKGSDLTASESLMNKHIVFGSESHGISEELESLCEKSIRIPSINSNAESLNLAISVGIICGFIHFNLK
ncbi:MAG: RNA methyltransferase [Flavobacteriales bacterium]|nr:RNA methyltransferase [Flavobacteriales bacterium]